MEEDIASDSLMEMIQVLEENSRLGIYSNCAYNINEQKTEYLMAI